MEQMDNFYRNAKRLGLCDAFSERWSNCKSKKQLYDLACDINSLQYLCESICKGWGLSADYIATEFAPFVNGKCVFKGDGYTSCIWCQPDTNIIKIDTTATLAIGFNGTVVPPIIGELYLCNSNIRLIGDGAVVAYLYNSNIVSSDKCEVRIKENKKY